jgi:hypothetical protein
MNVPRASDWTAWLWVGCIVGFMSVAHGQDDTHTAEPTAEPTETVEIPDESADSPADPEATLESESAPPPVFLTPRTRLDNAVRAYQTGQLDAGRDGFAALVNDMTYEDEDLRQEARLYLGEVLYRKQDQEAARRIFERVLNEDPDYRIDPFQHPPDVCGFFETIRAYIRPADNPEDRASGPAPPVPVVGYVGFGLYQLRYGRTSTGAVLLVGQTISGILSGVMMASVYMDRTSFTDDPDDRSSVVSRRAVQWTATGAFYGFWAAGIFDAGKHWRTTVTLHAPESRPDQPPIPGPPGLRLNLSGRFR